MADRHIYTNLAISTANLLHFSTWRGRLYSNTWTLDRHTPFRTNWVIGPILDCYWCLPFAPIARVNTGRRRGFSNSWTLDWHSSTLTDWVIGPSLLMLLICYSWMLPGRLQGRGAYIRWRHRWGGRMLIRSRIHECWLHRTRVRFRQEINVHAPVSFWLYINNLLKCEQCMLCCC